MKRYAVVIPACNEQDALPLLLAEVAGVLDARKFPVVVGVNGSSDRTADLARLAGVRVAQVPQRGYGFGCRAAVDLADAELSPVEGYLFLAADGANDPRDILRLVEVYEAGGPLMVLGRRTRRRSNWTAMNFHYVAANRIFGAWCGVLTGRFFDDLGPLRLIERKLFHALNLHEWTFGWTIEAQVRAVLLGARVEEVDVCERARIAGEQKVSHVSWRRTLSIGWQILAAGWRARF